MNNQHFMQRLKTPKLIFILLLLCGLTQKNALAEGFDFDSGNALTEIFFPTVAPFGHHISPSGGDASLILRTSALTTNAWFDAAAPYHPTAVGVYTRLGRRPALESKTNRNINIALLYASYRILNSLAPQQEQVWRDMLTNIGLNPDDDSTDLTTAIGIGNAAGNGVVSGREHDGMNQLGDEGDQRYNRMPYRDYTEYQPINTAYQLRDPSRWQPDMQRKSMGLYKIQQFVTPQYALVEPYSYQTATAYQVPPPVNSNHLELNNYKAQADRVLKISAKLTDKQKLSAEFFDDKIASLATTAIFVAQSRGLSLLEFIHLDFLVNMASFDAGIVIWQEKRRYDAVRPFSAIHHIYGDKAVTAWGGVGQGSVDDIPGKEWKSYLAAADHPEYPSASACFCTAQAQAARKYFNSDTLGFQVDRTVGSSKTEPGITPATNTTLSWKTWTEFSQDCGQSRVWAGVHFQAAVDVSNKLCSVFGDTAFEYINELIAGTAPERGPSKGIQ